MRFLIDENLPFGIVSHLQSLKLDVLDVADSSLRRQPDKSLWVRAAKEKELLLHETLITRYWD